MPRDIDPVAVKLAPVNDDVAHVDADAKFDPTVLGDVFVAGREVALHVDYAGQGCNDDGELRQDGVAGIMQYLSAVVFDAGGDGVEIDAEGLVGPFLIGPWSSGCDRRHRRKQWRRAYG